MDKEDIIRMAREAGAFADHLTWVERDLAPVFERFATLVAAHEREQCAKVCEEQMKSYMSKQYTTDPLGGFRERFSAESCAAAIRSRGEK